MKISKEELEKEYQKISQGSEYPSLMICSTSLGAVCITHEKIYFMDTGVELTQSEIEEVRVQFNIRRTRSDIQKF